MLNFKKEGYKSIAIILTLVILLSASTLPSYAVAASDANPQVSTIRKLGAGFPKEILEVNGIGQEMAAKYVLKGKHRVGVQVGYYDDHQALSIDPELVYSTYLGGSTNDRRIRKK